MATWKTIKAAAKRYRVAELRIWILVRQGVIDSMVDLHHVCINEDQLEEWAKNHQWEVAEWQKALEATQRAVIESIKR